MPTFRVAHLREQGQNIIIVPLDPDFGRKPRNEQHDVMAELQARANSAGLAGTVVPVWDNERWSHFFGQGCKWISAGAK